MHADRRFVLESLKAGATAYLLKDDGFDELVLHNQRLMAVIEAAGGRIVHLSVRDGALVERFAIHYSRVFASEVLTLKELALVEPMSVGYHAANRGQVSEVDAVLVIGCGTIGIGAVAASARKGATVIERCSALLCVFG